MSIVSADVVGETVDAVAGVWRYEKGRALAMIVSAAAVLGALLARFVLGPTDIQAAAVGAGIVVFGLAALAPYAEQFRPVPPPPLHPVHRDDVISKLEAIVLDRTSRNAEAIEGLRRDLHERDQEIDGLACMIAGVCEAVGQRADRLRKTS